MNSKFVQLLEQRGLLGLPFSWGDDGSFEFGPGMTAEQIAAVLKAYADSRS